MTGLLTLFRRHFVVLTVFLRNVMESRPYWPGGGEEPRTQPGRAPQVTDRAPQGWAGGWAGPGSLQSRPPTPAPVRDFRGPLRCLDLRSCKWALGCWTPVLPSRIPTQYTHPRYPPGLHQTPTRCSLPVVR